MARRVYPIANPRGGGGSAAIDTIFFYGAIFGGGYLTYTLALQGSLGPEATKIAVQIYAAFNGGRLPPARPTAPTGSLSPGNTGGPPAGSRPDPTPTTGNPEPTTGFTVTAGYVQDGYVFLGGDAGDPANWAELYTVPTGQLGYIEEGWVLIGDAALESGWAIVHMGVW